MPFVRSPLLFLFILTVLFSDRVANAQPTDGEVHVNFPILEILKTTDTDVVVRIDAGRVHSLMPYGTGDVWSVSSMEERERGGSLIGRARLVELGDSVSTVSITQDEVTSTTSILVGDLVELPVNLLLEEDNNVIFDLMALNITFVDHSGNLIYTFFDFSDLDRARSEEDVLNQMLSSIREMTELMRTLPDLDSSLFAPQSGGRFEGLGLFDAMERSTIDDVRSFLRFVRAYPAHYMGTRWKLFELYAYWISGNTPVAQDDLRDRLMAAGSDREIVLIVEAHRDDITSGDFLYTWVDTAERWMFEDYGRDGERLNRIVALGAHVLGDRVAVAWTRFLDGRLAEYQVENEKAVGRYREAYEIFKEADAIHGLSVSANNLGSILNSLSRYEEALGLYDTVIVLKRRKLEEENTPDHRESLAYTVGSRGTSLMALGRYREAQEAFEAAFALYDSAGTSTSEAGAAWALTRAANALSGTGDYSRALVRLDSAIAIYRSIGDADGEADVLDEIGYQYSNMGRYQESLRNYEAAYEIHLSLGDKRDAGFSKSNAGQMHWSLGDYHNAEKAHRLAILLREEAEDLTGQAYSWHKLGEMFRESGNPNAALEAYDKARSLYQTLGDRAHIAEVSSSIGDVYNGQKSWRLALQYYQEALNEQREIGAREQIATTLYNIGNVYYSDRKYEEAGKSFDESLTIRRELGDRGNTVYSLTSLGLVAWSLHDYEGAKVRFNEALALAGELDSRSDMAWCRMVIARVATQKGEYRSALADYTESLRLYRESGMKSGEIDALIGIGDLEVQQGKFDDGLARYEEAQRIASETNNRMGIGNALTAMAGIYLLMGDFERAIDADRRSLEFSREVDNPWGIGSAFTGLGNTYNTMGDFRQAIEYYTRADSVYRELDDTLSRAVPINNTGTVYFFQGDYDRALGQFNQVLQILRNVGQEDEFLAIGISNVGEVYYEQGRLADAETWLRQALELEEKLEARRMLASTTTILTKTMLAMNRLDEAQKLGARALSISQETGEQEQLAEINSVMGELALRNEDPESAGRYLKESVDISERMGSMRYLWRPLYHLGLIYREREDRKGAISWLERSVETIEKLRDKVAGGEAAQKLFASDRAKVAVYEALIGLLIEEDEIEKALGYLERSSSEDLRSRFKSLEPSFADPEKRELLEKGREMKARIDKLADQIASERAGSGVAGEKIERLKEIISVAENDYIKFVNETIREQPDLRNYFSAGVNPIELRQRKQKIPADMAVVSYLIGEGQIFAFVATADTVVARVIAAPRSDVEWTIRSFYRSVENPGKEDEAAAGSAELYDLLIAPIEDRIAGYGKLAIIPSGDLSYLPFGALRPEPSDERYLMERHTIFYISDLGVFLSEESNDDKLRMVAFGNADGSLPNAEKEVKDIAAIYPGSQVYLRSEATEEKAKNVPQGYNTLHFATHGNLDYRRFENSWLTLAPTPSGGDDGRLTLEEVWGISNLADCKLVTLSACNTAVSEEVVEGWPINPANAFLQVGVPRVVATLWQVDDEATAILMREFYGNLEGHGAAEALRLAQRTLASNPKYSSPYYWGPFVLLGDWR